jgi:asparaginyl-tRNA synthetase
MLEALLASFRRFFMKIHSIKDILEEKVELGAVKVAGWVRTKRGSKKFSFIELNDGSTCHSIQIIADAVLQNYESEVVKLTTGCSLTVEGNLVSSPGSGQKWEIHAQKMEVCGWAVPEEYPLQKKEMSLEYLREVAHMRPRTATFSSVFRIRSCVSLAIHEFFASQNFSYVHSPLITTTDGEGAGETFTVTSQDLSKVALLPNKTVDFSKDFFGQKSMLAVTGQLEAELMAYGLGKVYTFGPTFRAENSNTSRHLSEFWMIEPEMVFYDLEDTMQLGEDLIKFVVKKVLEKCSADLDVVRSKAETDSSEYLLNSLNTNFIRVSYTDAIQILKKSGQNFEFPVEWGLDLKSEHERFLCEKHFKAPTIVYNYPEELKAFYMYLNDDGKTVRAMDCLMPGIGEVIGGSQREDRYDVLTSRMTQKGIDTQAFDWYLDLRKFGSVPHSGFGMGLERLIVWITGMGNVRDVIPFPRVPGNARF